MNLQALETWLGNHDYRRGTVKLTLRQTKQAYAQFLADPHGDIHPAMVTSLKRAATYCQQSSDDPAFAAWLKRKSIHETNIVGGKKFKNRKLDAHSFSERDYRAIREECLSRNRTRDPEAHVIYTLACTGLRIGDVLRIPIENLSRGIRGARNGGPAILPIERKGGSWIRIPILGALDAWEQLYEQAQEYENVASFVTEGDSDSPEAGEAAYTRVRRYFEGMGEDLQLEGRVHLHRLRRTVAVRALKATDQDLVGVSQLLGHTTILSTQRYVDEIDAEHVAKIQQKIR
jgi:integrase